MTEELKSEGKCLYCGKMFSQKEIGKHLAEHLTIGVCGYTGGTIDLVRDEPYTR